MAPSPSTSSSSSYCPYDWRVKVEDYVHIELTPDNYPDWKQTMLDFIEMQGMEGFLINPPPQNIPPPPPPPPTITRQGEEVQNDGALTSEDEIDDGPDLKAWKRSDRLLRRWILATLSPILDERVSKCETARDVWKKLKENYKEKRARDKKAKEEEAKELKRKTTITAISDLMSAVWERKPDKFGREIVEKMSDDEVLKTDSYGRTALHVVAWTGNLEAVKLLESRNEGLLNICTKNGYPPLYYAALYGKRQVVDYLFPRTPEDSRKGNVGNDVARLLIAAGLYDVALNWIRGPPEWECDFEFLFEVLVSKLSSSSSSSESGMKLNFWQSLIYRFIKTNQKKSGDIESVEDHQVSVIETNQENNGNIESGEDIHVSETNQENSGDIESGEDGHISGFHTTRRKLYAALRKVTAGRPELQIEDVQKKKVMNSQAKELLRHLCSKQMYLHPEKIMPVLEQSLEGAVRTGKYGIVKEILASYKGTLFFSYGEMQHTLFHCAVIHRWEKVFDVLFYEIGKGNKYRLTQQDKEGNTVLHSAANLTPEQLTKLKQEVATPALQMQREVQWFQEVRKLMKPDDLEIRNYQQQTAAQLFTQSHKELLKEGEVWMKDTANSCSVVAALIVTIVFAAAITVPGGNNSEIGNPILFYDLAFKIFALSDGFAFFSSSISVFMFLSILTARFAEKDFLKSLPRRLIFGFISLFLSIISMMAAFSATVYLFLGQKKAWILALVTVLALLAVAFFVFLQFPLLWKMFKSTYFPIHFRKK